jgi:hypothetical protein
MATFSIMYIAVCEAFFAVIMGYAGFVILVASKHEIKTYLVGSGLVAVSAFCIWAGASLIWNRRRAWYLSLIAGFIVVGISCFIIWLALHADPYGDGGEGGLFGIASLIFALPAFVLLALSSTRRYLNVEKRLESNTETAGN